MTISPVIDPRDATKKYDDGPAGVTLSTTVRMILGPPDSGARWPLLVCPALRAALVAGSPRA
ncbi:hypothetical protein [Amycolatopsis benzoatilytica]|uniref:hypothetical protein n=1 Tax=Amycolatopsis benzoatilytica TaxID=346045 RepID=UPI000363FB33|nr:hypothetical protein [Amycolatopsis benzoatilytica]